MMFGMMEFTVGKIQVTYYKIGCVCFFGADCRIVCTLYIFVSSTLTSPTRPSPTLMGPRRLCSCGAGVTTDYLPRLPSTPLGKPLYRLGGLALPCPLTLLRVAPQPLRSGVRQPRCLSIARSPRCLGLTLGIHLLTFYFQL